MKVTYESNNSGGSWWLQDGDWLALEAAGWDVRWLKNEAFWRDSDERWLGALAKEASKEFPTLRDAMVEWAKITGQNPGDLGCSCCGSPHSFEGDGTYWYPEAPDSVEW